MSLIRLTVLASLATLLGCSAREPADLSPAEMKEALRSMAKEKKGDELWEREYKRLSDPNLVILEEDGIAKIGRWRCDRRKGTFGGNFLDSRSKPWLSYTGTFVKVDGQYIGRVTGETHSYSK
jgi:hypothetical protein